MRDSNKSFRIKYDLNNPAEQINIKIDQDIDFLEVLSLKIDQKDAYKYYTSNYGVIVGRVLANDGFGIPNAKISLFIPNNNVDKSTVNGIMYPYKSSSDKNVEEIRYNLLPSRKVNACHQNVGTLPSKRDILDNDVNLEVFDTYFEYSTVTNESGDYMLFGVPTGQQEIHVDIDLSDIGVLSQSPRDMMYKGYGLKQFDSPNKFKKSTNLDNLSQIISQNTSVFVYPFWGDETQTEIAISKKTINIQYKFEPTCVFMGSIFTDSSKSVISKTCKPRTTSGKMSELMSSQGTIEMIRKTLDGKIERFDINGGTLINGDGVWCYQIPMNLDYVITDEYGNLVPTTDPSKGIPTRTQTRFRITLNDNGGTFTQDKTGVYLVPNNPKTSIEEDFEFNSNCKDGSFIDLMWNKVYSVKNYIPRIQKSGFFGLTGINPKDRHFNGLKSVNFHESNNPTPYNNIYIDINLRFMLMCIITKWLFFLVSTYNWFVTEWDGFAGTWNGWSLVPGHIPYIGYATIDANIIGEGNCYESLKLGNNTLLAPISGSKNTNGVSNTTNNSSTFFYLKSEPKYEEILSCIETNLASENQVINFDFTNDWLNGSLYAPRFLTKTKKNTRNGTIDVKFCGSYNINTYANLYLVQTCAVAIDKSGANYTSTECDDPNTNSLFFNTGSCYKVESHKQIGIGSIKRNNVEDVYYYRPIEFNGITSTKNKYLYTTDIILLGSLNDCDIDGIPKLHQLLPSTSFKLPPDSVDVEHLTSGATYTYDCSVTTYPEVREISGSTSSVLPIPGVTSTDNGNYNGKVIYLTSGDQKYWKWNISPTGYTETTLELNTTIISNTCTGFTTTITGTTVGMSGTDWGMDNSITGKTNGLYVAIDCMDSNTITKTCINATRLCEIGVDFDESYEISGLTNSIQHVDGFISYDEISDGDVRGMFSTLNGNGLTTKKVDNKIKYDFTYRYPSGFDGRLRGIVLTDKTTNLTSDIRNDDYYNFRFGISGGIGTDYNDGYSFPRYDNSFYFYFGLKPGLTAIDLFNNQYYVPCTDIEKDKFNVTISDITNETINNGNDGSFNISVTKAVYPYKLYIDDVLLMSNINNDNPISVTDKKTNYYMVKIIDGNNNIVTKSVYVGLS